MLALRGLGGSDWNLEGSFSFAIFWLAMYSSEPCELVVHGSPFCAFCKQIGSRLCVILPLR